MLRKLFSLTIAVSLAVSSFPVSGFSAISSPLFNTDNVNSYASVTEASFKNSEVSVFNIQDLHFNIETQKKIFSLLEKLNLSYPDFELYVEGTSENGDFDWVYSSLGKKNGDVFLDALFESGNLSGAEYFAAKYGKKIRAVEDKQVHTKNLLLFAELIEQRAEVSYLMRAAEAELSSLRNKYFTSEQKRLFSAYQRFREGSMQDSDYFEFLKKESSRNNININDYPNLALYILTSGSVSNVSQKKLQSQMSSLFSNLKNILSYKQYAELLKMSDNMKDRQSLVSYLYQNKEKIGLDQYPELNKFIVSIAVSDKLNRFEFINEEINLMEELSSTVSTDENSKNIFFMSRFINTYKNVLHASVTADEYQYYKENISKFKSLLSQYISADGLARFVSIEKKAEEFNDVNILRNEIFIDKMFGTIAQPSGIYAETYFGVEANAKAAFENSSKSRVKVIVAGGFHTDGINDLLNKKQITNVTFMPKINSSPQDFSERYVEYARILSKAESSAIPEPVFSELPLEALAGRVLDTLAKSGFDLSLPEIKTGVESFLSARKEMESIKFSFDKDSGEMSVEYTEKNSGIAHSVKLSDLSESGSSESNLTMLGEIVPAMVRNMLKGASFNLTNTVPSIFLRMVKGTDYFEERYNGSDIGRLKKDISSGAFDYESFFSYAPSLLNSFIIKTLASLRNINAEYPNLHKEITERAAALLGLEDEDINVKFVDSFLLINEDGWCFAALSASEDMSTVTLYVHTEFLEELNGKSASERENILQELIMHELMENNALYNEDSPEYYYFGLYLNENNIGKDGRTTIGFHDFIRSPQFKRMLRQEKMTSISLKGQESLLRLESSVRMNALSRHEKIESLYRIKSFMNLDAQKQYDLLMLRLGDEAMIEKYADEMSEYIKNNILKGDGQFSLAVRFTEPVHTMQKIAHLIKEKTGLEIIYIEQDEYIDYAAMRGQVARENISGKFTIAENSIDDVADKKVIIIEDITKTGFIFGEMSKPLNEAGVESIIPLTIFNIIEALAPTKMKGVNANKSINELFNINDYLTSYMRENPEKVAEKIVEIGGNTTKYFYYSLSALMREKSSKSQNAFKTIVNRLNKDDSDTAKAKEVLVNNISSMHHKYPKTASSMIPIAFFIEHNLALQDINKRIPFTKYFERYRSGDMDGTNGILEISQEELSKWETFQWMLPLYCRQHGFTKIHIKLDSPSGKRKSRDTLLLVTAKQLNVNVLYEYQSEQIPEIENEELKDKIKKAIEDKGLAEAVDAARQTFKEQILANSADNGIHSDRAANTAYKNAIKKIMIEVDEIVREVLAENKYLYNPRSYSIVVGGSLVNGSATPNSDIYYDIIARDKDAAALIHDNFLRVYQYALGCTSIVPYVANGMKVDYPGSAESSLGTMLDATIYDERSIATFFDFEPIYEEKAENSEAFNTYQKHVFDVMMKKNPDEATLSTRKRINTVMRRSMIAVSKPYYKIIESGSYELPDEDSTSAERTFFGNLYVSAYNNSIKKAYDYRWVIRGVDVALKEILLQNSDKIDSLANLPRDKKELVMYMFEKGMFDKTFTKEKVEELQKSIRTISKYRQEKISRGNEFTWTEMSVAEQNAIKAIHVFIIGNVKPASRVDITASEADKRIVSYVIENYTQAQLDKVGAKLNRYEEWLDKESKSDDRTVSEMSTALLLSEFTREELYEKGGVLDQLGLSSKTAVLSNIDMLFSLRNLPSIDKIKGDFGIQNYMDAILKRAGSPERVYAVFADKVTDFLSPKYLEQYFEANKDKLGELLDYNKLTDYYLKKNQTALNEMLRSLPSADLNGLIRKEYQENSHVEIIKRLISNGSIAELLDRAKIAQSLKSGALKDLSTSASLFGMIESGHITDLLTDEGAETVGQTVRRTANLEKLSIYLIYIPLARRINDIKLFESIRNLLFSETQPELYLEMRQILEEYMTTELPFSQYETMLEDLKTDVQGVLKKDKISTKIYTRVKSLYSIFEKLVSPRKGEDAIREISKDAIKEKIKDVYGFHIVVDKEDMEKTMNSVESAFENKQFKSDIGGKKALYSLLKDKNGEIKRLVDHDIKKGFARVKYTYELNGLPIGEIIIYSKEEYENEHNGLIRRADPEIAESFADPVKTTEEKKVTGVVKALNRFLLTFPLAHWIYKMGLNISGGLKYADSVFKMQLSYEHLFYKDEGALDEIKQLIGAPEFYFHSDDIILDGNTEDALRRILNTRMDKKRAFVIGMPDGNSYPVMLESGQYLYYDILAIAGLDADKNYVLTDESGKELDPEKDPIPFFVNLKRVEGANPFDRDFTNMGLFYSTRAKLLAHLRGQPLGEIAAGEYFSRFSTESEKQAVEIFSNSLGLKNIEELYYAEKISAPIPEGEAVSEINKRKYVHLDKAALESFVMKSDDFVFEVRTSLLVGNEKDKILSEARLRNVLEKYGQNIYSDGDADKGEAVYKIIYSGNQETLQLMMSDLKEAGFDFVVINKIELEDGTEEEILFKKRDVYLDALRALGRNVGALIGEVRSAAADTAALAANALFALFDSGIVEGLFFDGRQLILQDEVTGILEDVKGVLSTDDTKYENYDYEFVISDNEDLILSEDMYALSTLKVSDEVVEMQPDGSQVLKERGKITLYVHEAFLRKIEFEELDDDERRFYMHQLALHESNEFLEEKSAGAGFDYEQYHKDLYSNADQIKLIQFAARIAKEEIIKRDKRQTADNVAAELTRSDELTAENPADFILLCGNDELATFDKTIELYNSGAIKEMIVVSGGVGRLTLPLIEKALELGMTIRLSDGTVLSESNDFNRLENLSDEELRSLINMSEADIIEDILLYFSLTRVMDPGKVHKDIRVIKENQSTNTRENFDNDVIKNIVRDIRASNGEKPVRFAYIQTPMQQLRTKATFNSVFKDEIISGEIEGVSVTVSDFYKEISVEAITRQAAAEFLRIMIYSLKGDTLPSINENGLIFDGVLDAGTMIEITSLLENSWFRKKIRKELLGLINNTKDANGNLLFPDKASIIEALADKVPQDSYQFESMKLFLDFIYYDVENGIKYKDLTQEALNKGRFLSKTPFALQKTAINAGYTPEYLSHPDRVFVFETENPVSHAELVAYMGSFDSQSFAITPKRYINPGDISFRVRIDTGLREIVVKAGLRKIETDKGVFYEIQYSVPFIYETSAADINEKAKEQILTAVFENMEVMEKLAAEGLDLSKAKDRLFVETLPQDRTLTTVDAVSERIAESAGFTNEIRKTESKNEKKGLFNEKLPVAAMLKNSGDTGIGEITSLQDYAERVLKPAQVNGFTMYDLFSSENPSAANYLLLDWMAVPEAQGVVSREDLAGDISSEKRTVNKDEVARKKILAAVKVYEKLSSEQRAEIAEYQLANASWLDSFAAQEREKYNIDIDNVTFVRIMALQQMYFERQLKETLLKLSDMDISMYIKGINSDNAADIISKWIASGITSFTLEIDSVDQKILDSISEAAAKSGLFINVAVKSRNMTPQIAKNVADNGYVPVVFFQDLNMYGNVSGYKVEINDETFEQASSAIEGLLENAAKSGAMSVDYPIGLLWGEPVSENAVEEYRVPALSKLLEGLKSGLFKAGQKIFEESYTGSYMNEFETGANINISDAYFDINELKTVEFKGQSLPAVYVAALLGSYAKQNTLSEIKEGDFEKAVKSLIDALGSKNNLRTAMLHFDKLLSEYRLHREQNNEEKMNISKAKIAGFLQGLSENIIINGRRDDKFSSKAMGKVFANLMAEAALFKAGYYPSQYQGELPVERVLSKIEDALFKQQLTLSGAKSEIEPVLLNLLIPIQKNGFTFDVFKAGEMTKSKDRSEKVSAVYAGISTYMLDIFIDKVATRDQIKKSAQISSIEAVRSIMSAA